MKLMKVYRLQTGMADFSQNSEAEKRLKINVCNIVDCIVQGRPAM